MQRRLPKQSAGGKRIAHLHVSIIKFPAAEENGCSGFMTAIVLAPLRLKIAHLHVPINRICTQKEARSYSWDPLPWRGIWPTSILGHSHVQIGLFPPGMKERLLAFKILNQLQVLLRLKFVIRKSPLPSDLAQFRKQCNVVRKVVSAAKSEHLFNCFLFLNCSSNLWTALNKSLRPGDTIIIMYITSMHL